MSPFGGEPRAATKSPRDIRQFGWTDADTIVYVAQEKIGQFEALLKEKKDDTTNVDDEVNEPPVRLWRISINDADKKGERLTDNGDRIQSCSIAPGGRHAVTIHERSLSYNFDHKDQASCLPLRSEIDQAASSYSPGRRSTLPASTGNLTAKGSTRSTPDSQATRGFSWRTSKSYTIMILATRRRPVSTSTGNAAWRMRPRVCRDSLTVSWRLLADGVRHAARCYIRRNGNWEPLKLAPTALQAIRVSNDGKTLVYLESSAISPPKWHTSPTT